MLGGLFGGGGGGGLGGLIPGMGGGGGGGPLGGLMGGGGGGVLGGLGLDMSLHNMPGMAAIVKDPNEQHLQAQMQRMGEVYGAARPEATQAQLNAMQGTLQGMQPYNNAMSMMYGGQFQQLPQVTSPISPYGHSLGNPASMQGQDQILGGQFGGMPGGGPGGDPLGGFGLGGGLPGMGGIPTPGGGGTGQFMPGQAGSLMSNVFGDMKSDFGKAGSDLSALGGAADDLFGGAFSRGLKPKGATDPGKPSRKNRYGNEVGSIKNPFAGITSTNSGRDAWAAGEVDWE